MSLFDKIQVLYEDDAIVVVNKPAGLVVTTGPKFSEHDTLVGWLLDRYGEGLRSVGSGSHRPGIVHRLDKDTSGVMVAVKNQEAFEAMVAQFKARKVSKEYVAWLWGNVQKTLKNRVGDAMSNQAFAVNVPLGRNPRNRMRFLALEDGKPAITEFKVEKVVEIGGQHVTLVHCYPKTGRTHQIRVHAKTFEHGIVGDLLYESKLERRQFRTFVELGLKPRLYLHAYKLGFLHPTTKEPVSFEAPIPESFGLSLR